MPFNIVRNDITRMHTDAIVNTANPDPVIGGGTDSAIYAAAGEEMLLQERKKIGKIDRGSAAATPAFGLHAKYIIHTVGPVWDGGQNGEFETLASCYANSLKLAEELGCKSISFPMVSTGVYGFPKDKALSIALGAIGAYLNEHDMEVTLVVFDPDSFQISEQIRERVRAFIDDEYVAVALDKEYEIDEETFDASRYGNFGGLPTEGIPEEERRRRYAECGREEEARRYAERRRRSEHGRRITKKTKSAITAAKEEADESRSLASPYIPKSVLPEIDIRKAPDPEALKKQIGETFQERLFNLMREKDMSNAEVYRRANISRQTFSKITRKGAKTTKPMVFALAFALKLDIRETEDLLAHAGYAFAAGVVLDMVVRAFIRAGIYDIGTVNSYLFDIHEELLGSGGQGMTA